MLTNVDPPMRSAQWGRAPVVDGPGEFASVSAGAPVVSRSSQQRVNVLAAIGVRDAAQRRGELLQARPALGPVRLAVAAGFEPAESCPSRAFEFCGW